MEVENCLFSNPSQFRNVILVIFDYICIFLCIFFILRVDSIMLVEEGFSVVSVDASDKMLKYALKKRWERRREPSFDNWGKIIFIMICVESLIYS